MSNTMKYPRRRRRALQILQAGIVFGTILVQSIQLNYSAAPSFFGLIQQGIGMMLVNAAVVALIGLLVSLAVRRWSHALLVCSVLTTVWSIANYYVIEFHGSPLFFSEFVNFKTAAAVAGSYRYRITKVVLNLLLMFSAEILAVWLLRMLEKKSPEHACSRRWIRLALLLADAGVVYATLLGPAAVKPRNSMAWTWVQSAQQYGYVNCIVEDLDRSRNMLIQPEGYSPDRIRWEAGDENRAGQPYPDVILILNETFCDLEQILDVQADADVFSPFYGLDGGVTGLAVAPGVGGGTNDSEFELLTSNSMYLLNRSAPFNYLHLDQTGGNLVNNLEALGYSTCAMHCGDKANYSRHRAYPEIGFDRIFLGGDAFSYRDEYGNRPWLDADNYRDLIDHYEAAGDAPRFFYLLTFQNHGGWEQNEPDFDTVHTARDFGTLSDDISEYLTSVRMSVQAFVELTEYFSNVDRPVIVCMVGDHAPSFIRELPDDGSLPPERVKIAQRSVPYIIWANYAVQLPAYPDYADMTDLVPMVMQAAGLPLTPYYEMLLALHESVPVRLPTGVWMDRNGTTGSYPGEGPYDDLLTQYYYMEYNALKGGRAYRTELFELADGERE